MEHVPDEQVFEPLPPVISYPAGTERVKGQSAYSVMSWVEPSPANDDEEELHPVIVMVCCEPPFTELKVAERG